MKVLLRSECTSTLKLDNWCQFLNRIPFEIPESEVIFQRNITDCKISKFKEINYKILSRTLVTPKIVSKIRQADNLRWCAWYQSEASLGHILLQCMSSGTLHDWIEKTLKWKQKPLEFWLFGSEKCSSNPIVWICNFMKYKAHLIACDGCIHDLSVLFAIEATRFAPLYSILQNIDWFSVL